MPPQSVVPVMQTQLPLVHIRPGAHAFPHDPQLSRSMLVLVHDAPHIREGAGQPHTPLRHVCPAAHAVAQVPQCASVVSRLVSQPFATVPSQSPHPG